MTTFLAWLPFILWVSAFIAIIVLATIVAVSIIRELNERTYGLHYYETTKAFVKENLRYVVNISAPIRGGKTSLMCALGHAYTEIIIDNCQSYIQWFRDIFIELDYREVDNCILEIYSMCMNDKRLKLSISNIQKSIINICPQGYFDGTYYDHIQEKPKKSLLYTYIEDYISLLDSDFTWSNVYFHNRITDKDARFLSDKDFNLKDVYSNKEYVLGRNTCYLFDEETITRQSQNFQNENKEDRGRDTCYRTFGQMFLETSYIITTAQVTSRIYKLLRELYNCHVQVNKLKVVATLPFFNRCLDFVKFLNYQASRVFRFLKFKENKRDEFDNTFNRFKVFNKVIEDIRRYYYSGSFLVWNCDVAFREIDVGKTRDTGLVKNFDFCFPIRYSFGTYNTHYYAFLHDELLKNSKLSPRDRERLSAFLTQEAQENMTKEILKKSKEENESEEY